MHFEPWPAWNKLQAEVAAAAGWKTVADRKQSGKATLRKKKTKDTFSMLENLWDIAAPDSTATVYDKPLVSAEYKRQNK